MSDYYPMGVSNSHFDEDRASLFKVYYPDVLRKHTDDFIIVNGLKIMPHAEASVYKVGENGTPGNVDLFIKGVIGFNSDEQKWFPVYEKDLGDKMFDQIQHELKKIVIKAAALSDDWEKVVFERF